MSHFVSHSSPKTRAGARISYPAAITQDALRHAAILHPTYPVEGAFVSDIGVQRYSFTASAGDEIISSLTGSGFD